MLSRSRLLGSLLLTIAEIPLERRAIQKLPAFSGPRINSRSSRLSLRLPLRRPAARGLALGSMLWLRSGLRVRPRAISVPLTRNCTELAALDAICRGLSVCNYVRERFRIPLSPPASLYCRETFPLFPGNTRNMPVCPDIRSTSRTAENLLLGSGGGHRPRFSPNSTCTVRFQGGP